ncbi:carboxylesterase/lipase family protein [Streptomyces longwoodensis]|uniref:carboxylesterase/lipase family protein n=1 Tax=Streptomyces longwoodensis TaxID=68231 RepID=UPI003826F3A5
MTTAGTDEQRDPHGAPVVRTAAGAVRGRREGGLSVFRGIPYAAPPVGEARFREPRPPRPWDGVREAYAFGPPPPQEPGFQGSAAGADPPAGDDWLTVNVWTPETGPRAPRPVMVWIHGGAYKLGHAGSPGFDAQHIARAGDLVVVSLNYRLGAEGFAWIEGAPANRGLLDQVAALRWVRENVAGFGGDPGRVTVFGQSAGAGSVASLTAMPRARGLFRRAIAQSVPGTFFSPELAADVGRALAARAGLRPTAHDLSTADPHALAGASAALSAGMAADADRWGLLAPTSTPYSPVVDGEVLPTTPWQALADGAGRDVELVVGHTAREYQLFVVLGGLQGRVTEERAAGALRLCAPGGAAGERAYREAFPDAGPAELFERVQSDWLFRMPSLRLAEAQVAGGGRAHVYELTWPAPGAGGALGACHNLDVPLLFGTYHADLGRLLFGDGEVPEAAGHLSECFRTAWTGFARTSDPGWPAYDPEERRVRVLDAEPRVGRYPEEASRRLWRDHRFGALSGRVPPA